MKNMFKVVIISIIALCLGVSNNVLQARNWNYETERKVEKVYSVNSDVKLSIDNKYGDINVYKGSNNSVKIEILVKVKADKESVIQERMKLIDFNFSNSADLVTAKTIKEPVKIKTKGNYRSGRVSIEIDYNVYVPENFEPDFIIKYGDINFNMPVINSVNIEAKYGDINAPSLLGSLNNINVGYGDVEIDNASDLNLIAKYGDIELGRANNVNLNVSYTDFSAKSVNTIKMTEFRYGDISIDRLNKSFVCKTLAYSSVEIDECSQNVEQITILGRYSDIEIGFAPNTKFKGSIYTRYSKFNAVKELDIYYKNPINSNNSFSADIMTKNTSGKFIMLDLSSEYGDISLDVY